MNYDCYRTAAAALYLARVVSLVSLVRQVTETGTVLLPVYKNMQKKGTVRVSYDTHIFLQSFSILDSGGAASHTCLHKKINKNSLVERLILWTLNIWKRQKQESLRGRSQHLADGVVTELGELLAPFFFYMFYYWLKIYSSATSSDSCLFLPPLKTANTRTLSVSRCTVGCLQRVDLSQ